jgi:hypothetical protein
MRSDEEVHRVFNLAEAGLPPSEIARRVGVSRATVGDWLDAGEQAVLDRPVRTRSLLHHDITACPLSAPIDAPAYAYVLGWYLGDGRVRRIGNGYRLLLTWCDGDAEVAVAIAGEAAEMVERAIPGPRARHVVRDGCTEVQATSPHWPCLLPHGPGADDDRAVVLLGWQRVIALEQRPHRLLRGLVHSGACHRIDRIDRGGRGRGDDDHPRYVFTSGSRDVHQLFLDACDRLGIEAHRRDRRTTAVARRASVERLDDVARPRA